jgi:hypothetical protein
MLLYGDIRGVQIKPVNLQIMMDLNRFRLLKILLDTDFYEAPFSIIFF